MGVYLSIISGAIKLCNFIAAALQQHHDEMNGVTAQTAADQAKVIQDVETSNAAVGNPAVADYVRDKYQRPSGS